MADTPTPQTIPSDTDYEVGQRVTSAWLDRWPSGVAPHSNAANDLRDRIAQVIAEQRGGDLLAEQCDGPVELDVLEDDDDGVRRAAVVAALRRLPELTRVIGGLDSVVLPLPSDPEGVRIVAVRSLDDWLEGLATSVQYGGTL